jgi:hypothetical protein
VVNKIIPISFYIKTLIWAQPQRSLHPCFILVSFCSLDYGLYIVVHALRKNANFISNA